MRFGTRKLIEMPRRFVFGRVAEFDVTVKVRSARKTALSLCTFFAFFKGVTTEETRLPRHNHSAVMELQNVYFGCAQSVWHKLSLSSFSAWDKDRPLGPLGHLVTVVMRKVPRGRYHRTLRHLIHNWATECIKIVLRYVGTHQNPAHRPLSRFHYYHATRTF